MQSDNINSLFQITRRDNKETITITKRQTEFTTLVKSKDGQTDDPSIINRDSAFMKILEDNAIASGYDSCDYIQTDWIENELFPHKCALKAS